MAIASDIHADARADAPGTHVSFAPGAVETNTQPLRDLYEYVRTHDELKADFLLFAGDLANQANGEGAVYAWADLHLLANRMGARLIATPGNHDIVTHDPNAERLGILQTLHPTFPTGDDVTDIDFWSRHFTVIEDGELRIVVLDSCAEMPPHPGSGATEIQLHEYKAALNRGGISTHVLRSLGLHLNGLPWKPVNILLLHHHPQEHQLKEVFKDYHGAMRQGDRLIDLLGQLDDLGRWIVIHGHKHIPQITQVAGDTSSAPIVLCAASLGADLWKRVSTVTRNEFHIIEFDTDSIAGLGSLKGTVSSWSWGYSAGWAPPDRDLSGLPALCGFGAPVDVTQLAAMIDASFARAGVPLLTWSEMSSLVPPIRFQFPKDLQRLELILDRDFEISVFNQNGRPIQYYKRGAVNVS